MTDDDRTPTDGPQDATSGWVPPTDPMFDDVLTSSDPLTAGPALPGVPAAADPYSVPPSPPPPSYPPPPGEPTPSTWLPIPSPQDAPFGGTASAPQDLSTTTPPYAPRPPLPPPPAGPVAGPPATPPPWAGPAGRRRRRSGRALAVAVAALLVLVAGTITVAGLVGSRRTTTPTPARTPEPALGQAGVVTPTGGPVTSVVDPTRIRLEVLAAAGTVAAVRYDGDGEDATRLRGVPLPWAVEAPIDALTSMVSLSATVDSDEPRGQRPVAVCRVWLDGVLVLESAGRGTVSCYAFLDDFRAKRGGDGEAALTGVVPVTPGAMTIPVLPARAGTVTFEAYESVPTKTLNVRFGSGGSANKVELDDQTAPFARRAVVPTGVDLVSISAGDYDYDTERGPTLMCRILVDEVPVETSVGTTSATCSISLRSLLGS